MALQMFLSSALNKYVGTYGSVFHFEDLENFRKKGRLYTPLIQRQFLEKRTL